MLGGRGCGGSSAAVGDLPNQHLLPERSLSRKAGLHPRRDTHPAVSHSVGPPLTLVLDLVELTKVFKGQCGSEVWQTALFSRGWGQWVESSPCSRGMLVDPGGSVPHCCLLPAAAIKYPEKQLKRKGVYFR